MVSAVVTFKRPKQQDSTSLLNEHEKESTFNKKKKGSISKRLSGVFKSKKDTGFEEYEPPTAPSSPETPLSVTVLTSGADFDRSTPYDVNNAISDLTPHNQARNGKSVGFDTDTEYESQGQAARSPMHRQTISSSSLYTIDTGTKSTYSSERSGVAQTVDASAATPKTASESACTETKDYISHTLGLFDEICRSDFGKDVTQKNLDDDLAAAASVGGDGTTTTPQQDTTVTGRSEKSWEDEDSDTLMNSLETTLDDSTLGERTKGTSVQSSRTPKSLSGHHENFEVILDSSRLKLNKDSDSDDQSPNRRGWFAQRRDEKAIEETTNQVEDPGEGEEVQVVDTLKPANTNGNADSVAHGTTESNTSSLNSQKKKSLKKLFSNVLRGSTSNTSAAVDTVNANNVSTKKDTEPVEKVATNTPDQVQRREERAMSDTSESLRGINILKDDTGDSTDDSKKEQPKNKRLFTKEKQQNVSQLKGKKKDEKLKEEKKLDDHVPKKKKWGSVLSKLVPKANQRSKEVKVTNISQQTKSGNNVNNYDTKQEKREVQSPTKAASKKPKPSWKAVVDPNTGRTYYYHRKTRETTWKKPTELIEAEEVGNEQAKQIEKHESTSDVKSSPTKTKLTTPSRVNTDTKEQSMQTNSKTPPKNVKTEKSVVCESPDILPETAAAPVAVAAMSQVVESSSSPIQAQDSEQATPKGMVHHEDEFGNESFDQDVPLNKLEEGYDEHWDEKKEGDRVMTLGRNNHSPARVQNNGNTLLHAQRHGEETPFDEPYPEDEIEETRPVHHVAPPLAVSISARGRTGTTHASRTSATTRSSAKTDKTEKVKNTAKGQYSIGPISENKSTATSITSDQDGYSPRRSPYRHMRIGNASPESISRTGAVTRNRELRVEEFNGGRVVAETFDDGRVVRGQNERVVAPYGNAMPSEDTYYGDNEVETHADSISALSDNELDFMHRKDNFDNARRRALDDAIARQDWELAAALSEGMRSGKRSSYSPASGYSSQHELGRHMANNDWDAVSSYISHMRDKSRESLNTSGSSGSLGPSHIISSSSPIRKEILPPIKNGNSILKATSQNVPMKSPTPDSLPFQKRIGSRSQLQHGELQSISSWESDGSSYYSEYDSELS